MSFIDRLFPKRAEKTKLAKELRAFQERVLLDTFNNYWNSRNDYKISDNATAIACIDRI